ncbi:unnamed protein product [Rangifer tarandus platyrhynchus]|uniref:Uncharacterized protein n=1 Tax=Rangifer tarandus platyrhynchus TaxID=3082113 RepID=A0ABN8YVS9_RANTA|nr:unnamed protein product [Rangifer tarandus platyrhynchus]
MVLFIVLRPALAPAFSSSLSALHAMLPRAPLICSAQRPGDERADRCLVASRQARGTVSKLQTRGSRALPAKGREERGQQREGVGPPCRPGGLHLPWSRRPGTGSPPQHHLGRNLPDLGGENTAPTPPFLPGSVGIRLDDTGPGDREEAGGEAKAPSCGPTSQGCSPGDDMVPCTDRPPGPGG